MEATTEVLVHRFREENSKSTPMAMATMSHLWITAMEDTRTKAEIEEMALVVMGTESLTKMVMATETMATMAEDPTTAKDHTKATMVVAAETKRTRGSEREPKLSRPLYPP
jgi:hypothetical protein